MRTLTYPRILVTGAGGFIGNHLVTALKQRGYWVRGAYGWEKLVAERLCQYYTGEFRLEARIVRFHNIYGPYGTYGAGRLREVLGWEPSVTLRQGLEPTYRWIEKQVLSRRPPWAAVGR